MAEEGNQEKEPIRPDEVDDPDWLRIVRREREEEERRRREREEEEQSRPVRDKEKK